MRVLFACGREPQYPRNIILRACLASNNDVQDAVDTSRSLAVRYARVALKLLATRRPFDLACVGFLGHPLMPLMRLRTRRPILFDVFISVYDTLCFDRECLAPASLPGRVAYWTDWVSCRCADHILLDTDAHIDYFHRVFGVPCSKMSRLFVGCDEQLFAPRPYRGGGYVLFYGSYLHLHAIDVIIRAAKLLEPNGVPFRLIGGGSRYEAMRRLASDLGVRNVEFLPWVPLEALPAQIAGAAVCLGGHFGASGKAQRVIAGKTFQCLAMARPTIVGDNPANAELLTHGHDAWFCPPSDPDALAAAIRALLSDPGLAARLGRNGARTFMAKASVKALTAELEGVLGRIVKAG